MVDETARGSIERVNEKLADSSYKLAVISIVDFELLDKNARFMTNETFRNLVENIKRDNGLSSVPFCWKRGDKYRVLSGNHRVMAAKEAGLTEIPVMFTDKELTRDEEVAIQLSHNSLVGSDDMNILKSLYEEIEDLSMKYYAGLDDKTLEEMRKVSIQNLQECRLDFRTLTIMFLPEEAERLEEVLGAALQNVASKDILLARFDDFDRLITATAKASGAYNIKNTATALMLILDLFEQHQLDLQDGWIKDDEALHKGMVPLSSIFGTDMIPAHSAAVVKKAVEMLRLHGDVTKKNLWQSLEYMAADFLGGEG